MSERLTPAELAELEAMERGATAGPWQVLDLSNLGVLTIEVNNAVIARIANVVSERPLDDDDRTNADLIAAARNALPRLLAEVREQREWIASHDCQAEGAYFKGVEVGLDSAELLSGSEIQAPLAKTVARLTAERDDLRRQWDEVLSLIAEAGFVGHHPRGAIKLLAENRDALRAKLEQAEALIGELRECLGTAHRRAEDNAAAVVELRAAIGKAQITCSCGFTRNPNVFAHARDCGVIQVREALSAPNPGAGLLAELEGLRQAADALAELVALKDLNDSLEGKPPGSAAEQEYRERKPHAWDAAREALDQLRAGLEGGGR